MTRWLKQLVDIREGERAVTLAMFVSILIVITVLTIVKSVRQALFLQNFGAASLPYVYMMIAAISGLVATLYQRMSRNTLIHRAVIATQFAVIVNLLVFRALLSLDWEPLTYVLYVWVAVYGILSTAQFWAFANYLYDPRQAKRIFAILGVGATAGGIVGGYITQYAAPIVGTENLMLLCCGLLLVCAALTWLIWRARRETILEAARNRRYKTARAEKTAGSFRLIWESRYLKLIMAVISVSIVISTVVDNQFSFVVEENIPTKDEKTAFFGKFFTYLGWAAFVTQFLFTGRLLRRFGVAATMLILPLATFLGSGLFVLAPMLTTGLLVKIADGSFRYTTHKAALELLYLPVPIAVKNRTKTFIDVFTDRFSKGIAALIVLLFTSVLGLHYTSLSWLMMGLALLWIIMSFVVRREYTAAFRDSLLKRRVDEDSLQI
ncbi:MAG TPA: Npt1/Npt2 family nucleotide transporter, partial [bacterium]|nr:Npt1/Npt2 family nucleotide transporter [bacterium]